MLLMAVYLIATGSNALGLMLCDCTAHSRHSHCCSHAHHDHIRTGEHADANFSNHCSCTHRHGEADPYIISSDDDKQLKVYVADIHLVVNTQAVIGDTSAATVTDVCDISPVIRPPLIAACAPRAPSFSA